MVTPSFVLFPRPHPFLSGDSFHFLAWTFHERHAWKAWNESRSEAGEFPGAIWKMSRPLYHGYGRSCPSKQHLLYQYQKDLLLCRQSVQFQCLLDCILAEITGPHAIRRELFTGKVQQPDIPLKPPFFGHPEIDRCSKQEGRGG